MEARMQEWLTSPSVKRAMEASGWRQNGDTPRFLQAILDDVDAEPTWKVNEDAMRDVLHEYAVSFVETGVVGVTGPPGSRGGDGGEPSGTFGDRGRLTKAILMLLDLEAKPEHMIESGFPASAVGFCVNIHQPWRIKVRQLAASGCHPSELLDAAPNVRWERIEKVLALHGYEVEQPPRRRHKNDERRELLTSLAERYAAGEGVASLAKEHGISSSRLHNIFSLAKRGDRYRYLTPILREAA